MEEQHTIKGTFGNLRGIIHKTTFPSKGVVILIHGYFTSTKLGPENLYVQIARIFANCGYEFWRFDSYGVGDSDGNFHESTYESRIIDYKIITELALKQSDNILILGHSVGTSIAVYLANMFPQNIKTLFFIAPSFGMFTDALLSKEKQISLQKQGFVYRRTQLIKKDFIDKMVSENIYQEVLKCNAKYIIFYGVNDEFYDRLSLNRVMQYMKNHTLIEISECDHNFLNNRDILLNSLTTIINDI